jgi:hypothetical protein
MEWNFLLDLLCEHISTEEFFFNFKINKKWYQKNFTPSTIYLTLNSHKKFKSEKYLENFYNIMDVSNVRIIDLNDFQISNTLMSSILSKTQHLNSLSLTNISDLKEIKIPPSCRILRLKLMKDLENVSFENENHSFDSLNVSSCRKLNSFEGNVTQVKNQLLFSKFEFSNEILLKSSNLKELNLKMSGKISESISFKNLKITKLNVSKCSMNEIQLSDCLNLNLKSLNFWSCSLKSDFEFFEPSNLTYLNLSCNKEIKNECILSIVKYCKKLKSLHLWWCEKLNDNGISELKNLDSLEVLNLNWISNITDVSLINISKLSKLTTLNVSKCFKITDEGISGFKNFEQIDLSECPLLTDEGIIKFFKKSEKTLKNVNLFKCSCVTDQSASFLAQNCKFLDFVNLNGTKCSNEMKNNILEKIK